MNHPLHRLPLAAQTATHLREGFQSGRWVGQLPGVLQLAGELMVSDHTVRAALKVLEKEGWIEDCGPGRRKRIVEIRHKEQPHRALRIGIMPYVPLMGEDLYSATILFSIRHSIEMSGHICIFSEQSLKQMKDNLSRISHCVKTVDADAWIVFGASRNVLEWFVAQPFPVFAYGGRFQNLAVASSASRIAPAIESAVNALVKHGHQRIVLLIETSARKPTLIPSLECYLTLLKEQGIAPTSYNLPHYEDTAEGLQNCLDELFRLTPPTALIVHQTPHCVAILAFLARRGLRVPHDVSIICMTPDPVFSACLPPLDQFRVPGEKHITRMTRWVDGVAHGRADQHQTIFEAVYVPGGTVGPARK